MKIKSKLIWLTLFVAILNITHSKAQDPNFHIYLCFGQSNMEGQGTIETQDMTVNSRFQVMEAVDCTNLNRTKGNWYTATPPLCRCSTGLSPVDYFGRTMIETLPENIKVGVIHVAIAGCSIDLFDKDKYLDYINNTAPDWMMWAINDYGGNPYGHMVNLAQQAQQNGVIKGILLHQGETNTGDINWSSNVKGIYDNLITDLDLNSDEVPLLAGEVVNADQGGVCSSMNSIIATLPNSIANAHIISSSGCTAIDDNLHFSSAGYRELGKRYAQKMLTILGYELPNIETESLYIEAECGNPGTNWDIVSDSEASNEQYITAKIGFDNSASAPTDESDIIKINFTVNSTDSYNVFARLNCANFNDDSFWIKIDNREFGMYNGLVTAGWQWMNINSFYLTEGDHTITIAFREDGALLDKINITNSSDTPIGLGDSVSCDTETSANSPESNKDYNLYPNYPNPFSDNTNIQFELPTRSFVSLKLYSISGKEIVDIINDKYEPGTHTIIYNGSKLPNGTYFITIKAGDYSETLKMIKLTR